jgi:hypothetical protein
MPDERSPDWLTSTFDQGLFPGLPFFLQDVRPQGYLGRAIGREAADTLMVNADPENWSDDDLLSYLLQEGADLPGNIIVGDRALERTLDSIHGANDRAIAEANRASAYPELAAAAQRGEVSGSSAGGEQPKFLAMVRPDDGAPRSVLVKFTSAESSPISQRWADLLLCEHFAAVVLARHGIASAVTRIIDAGGRRFLEVERFDRVARSGRRGQLTLGTVIDALLDHGSPDERWTTAASDLEAAGLLEPSQARELRWRWCFGNLIANSDMHRSNTSVWFGDALPFSLAPSYDMLPMLFRPGDQGDLAPRAFEPRPPLPAFHDAWREAATAAVEFWEQVLSEPRISPGFRAIATQAAPIVAAMSARHV